MTASSVSTAEWALGRVAALALASLFFFGLPALARSHWDALRAWVDNDALFFVVGTWSANALLTVAGNLLLLPVYALRLPFFEKYKISSKPWPWHSPDPAERAAFWPFLWGSIARVCFNNLFIALPGAWSMWVVRQWVGGLPLSSAYLPDSWTLLWQLAVCLVVEDTCFYWCHRTLHHPALYPYVHKRHHEYRQSFSLASEHAHAAEFLLGNLLPVMAGPNLLLAASIVAGNPALAMHAFTLWAWILVRIGVSIDEHCGYIFPWSPVHLLPDWLGASTAGHDWHHSRNIGMFASQFAWWDAIMGTDKEFRAWQAKQKQQEGQQDGVKEVGKEEAGHGEGAATDVSSSGARTAAASARARSRSRSSASAGSRSPRVAGSASRGARRR